MKIGVVTVDRAEQSSHDQKKKILREYPDLLIVEIAPYNDNSFDFEIPQDIITECSGNKAKTAILTTIRRITPDPEEFITACNTVHAESIHLKFIEEPWLDTDIWYRRKQTSGVAEMHRLVVQSTYDRLSTKSERIAAARKKGTKTSNLNGTHPGPKKGVYSKETPLTKQRRQQILDLSPSFNDTDLKEKDIYTQMGISDGVYFKHLRVLKERYPERVRDKKSNKKAKK